MRRYAKCEYAKEKCRICGYRNKVYTPLYDIDQCERGQCICGEKEKYKVGYQLKCCNCGHVRTYRTDYRSNTNQVCLRRTEDLVKGQDICYRPSPCWKKDCPLYDTCKDFWGQYDSGYIRKEDEGPKNSDDYNIQNDNVIIEIIPDDENELR